MDINQLIGSGMLLTAGGTIIYSLKSIPITIFNKIKRKLTYTVRIYQSDELYEIMEDWFRLNCSSVYRDVEGSFKGDTISYKQEDSLFTKKYKGKRLLIISRKEKLDKAQNLKDLYFHQFMISGFLAKDIISELIQEAIEQYKAKKSENSAKVFCNTSWGEWLVHSMIKVKPLNSVVLNSELKEFITEDINKFLKSEEWYGKVNIPYKRGYCFYGPPGTGKTTLAVALANHTKKNIYCLDMNGLESARLSQVIKSIQENSILLIEDIDRIYSGRESATTEIKASFSAFLNCLDGAFYKHGLVTIITTNHIDKLDEALLRSGRMDIVKEIPKPSYREISEYLSLFYEQKVVIEGEYNIPMSQVQEICLLNRDNMNDAKKELTKKCIKKAEILVEV